VARFTEKWEQDEWSLFVACPQRGTLLCATNQAFLEEVLLRMNREHKDRAFPDELPEWQHVNVNAPIWAIRHYRQDSAASDPSSPLRPRAAANVPDSKAVGLVFWFDTKPKPVAKARYLTGAKDGVEIATEGWRIPPSERPVTLTIKEIKSGVIEISAPLPDDKSDHHLFLFVLLSYLGHAVYF
jgi:hypothetical protein